MFTKGSNAIRQENYRNSQRFNHQHRSINDDVHPAHVLRQERVDDLEDLLTRM